MTATAANARLLGCTEGPSDAWRTALALRADAQQSRPSAQRLHSAACQLGLDGAVCRSLAYERLMRRCKVWRALQIVWLDRLVGRGWHAQSPQNDVSCPVRSILPARGAEELWLSSSSSTPLVDVFIFLLWSRRKKCVVGPMTRDTSFGAKRTTATRHPQASAFCDVVRTHLAYPHGIGMNPSITISSMARWRPVIKQPPERTAMLPTAECPNSRSRPLSSQEGMGKAFATGCQCRVR